MSKTPESLAHMLAAWNEPEPGLVRSHLDKALSPEVRFVDPSIDLTGIDAFEANIHDVRAKNPGVTFNRVSDVDSQHGFHRYHWAINNAEGKLVLPGFDVVETDEQGKVLIVIGFFGELSPQ